MPIDINKLEKFLQSGEKNQLPPVNQWQPERQGEIDIHIDSLGNWFHEGEPFERIELVKLFSSILRKDGDDYYLVTPAEKLMIKVDDVPFEIVSIIDDPENRQKIAITNLEDTVVLDENAGWQLRLYQDAEIPYIKVRDDLYARMSRNLFYQLVDAAEVEEEGESRACYFNVYDKKFLLGKF